MDDWLVALTAATAIGCGLGAGALLPFSAFVMRALGRLPAAQGIATMQSFNVGAITPAFMAALFAPLLGCVAVVVSGIVEWDESFGPYLVGGGAIYVVGTIGLTIAYHVPRNDALAAMDPAGAESASYWPRYLAEWTRWNHVRVLAGLAAAAVLTVAIHVG